jgi:glycosyltransferase involved in cell wall biosynthesis
MHIAIVTAGGAGMFCGSCMHDNTLARALIGLGHEVSLVPTYTPIRVDEENVSSPKVLLGGVNVYLDAMVPLWSRLPRFLTSWLDSPRLLSAVSRLAVSSDAHKLGKLTVALLRGDEGPEQREVADFARVLGREIRPDVICYSNALLAGTLPRLKKEYDGPVFCLLQGDDIFLQDLPEPYREQSLALIRQHVREFDGFLFHSAYYRDFMGDMLAIPAGRSAVVPLSLDLQGHDGEPRARTEGLFTVGYFARICPEKGLHRLIDAFRILHARQPATRLVAGGYLGTRDRAYFERLVRETADLGDAFTYAGSPPDHAGKVAFLKSLDVLSVPTTYREPKGLYVLEALANGVPVVQPRHGAFPELLELTGGGLLVEPEKPLELAQALESLMLDEPRRLQLARTGWETVRSRTLAEATVRVFAAPRQGGGSLFPSERDRPH